MPQLVEVRFKGTRKGFYRYDGPDDDRLRLEEPVVVAADRGLDFGRISATGETAAKKCGGACRGCSTGDKVATASQGTVVAEAEAESAAVALLDEEPETPALPALPDLDPDFLASLPRIVRRATQDDVRKANDLRRAEEGDRTKVVVKVREHGLDMKISDLEWQWDRAKLVVYFTSENRVDFRALVKELAGAFRTRMELRQIGVRDEAARLGGIGRCGREFCCSTWLTDLSPVNLSLAKDQHLSLNPQQISGGCGRLLCCLRYEHEFYVASRKRFPKDGKAVYTLRGKERVVAVDIFRERVFLRSDDHGPRIVQLVELQEEQAQATAAGIGPDNPVGIVPVMQAGPGRVSIVQRAAEQGAAEGTFTRPEPNAPQESRRRSEDGARGGERGRPRDGQAAQGRGEGKVRSEPSRGGDGRGRDGRSRGDDRARRGDAAPGAEGRPRDEPRASRDGAPASSEPGDRTSRRGERRRDGRAGEGERPPRERRPGDGAADARDARRDAGDEAARSRRPDAVDAEGTPAAERDGSERRGRRRRGRGPRPEGDTPAAERPSADGASATERGDGARPRRNRRRGRGPRPDAPPSSES